MTKGNRRSRKRFQPDRTTFVAVRPEFDKLGKLLDITIEGLCFQYMAQEYPNDDETSLEVDIFISNNGFYLQNIPCECVYDNVIEDMTTLAAGIAVRRCGIKFSDLSGEQVDALELYINKYTVTMDKNTH